MIYNAKTMLGVLFSHLLVILLLQLCLLQVIESGGAFVTLSLRIAFTAPIHPRINPLYLPANNLHMMDGVSTPEIIGGDVFFEIIDPPELEYTFRIRPAKNFGGIFNSSFKLEGARLVLADPEDACTKIHNWEEMYGQVALVERGECAFLEKAIRAQKAGAAAVIVTDSLADEEEQGYYIEMVHDNTGRDVSIPAGFLLGKNGQMIRRTLNKLGEKHALINIPVNLTFVAPHEINHPPWLGW